MCLKDSENCKSLVLQDKCNIEIFLSPVCMVIPSLNLLFYHKVFESPVKKKIIQKLLQ